MCLLLAKYTSYKWRPSTHPPKYPQTWYSEVKQTKVAGCNTPCCSKQPEMCFPMSPHTRSTMLQPSMALELTSQKKKTCKKYPRKVYPVSIKHNILPHDTNKTVIQLHQCAGASHFSHRGHAENLLVITTSAAFPRATPAQ